MDVDAESLQNATQAVQAMERLYLNTHRLTDSGKHLQLKEDVHTALDQLRAIKASVEGSANGFIPMTVHKKPLQELKQLLLMHVPSSITENTRQQFSSLIEQALKGQCKKILAAIVLTCPWYEATQKERGEQAKHNILLVIVMSHDHQFFTPVNPQIREAGSVVDMGWLSVVEMSHFGGFLVRGRTRFVEALFCPDTSLIYSSEEWCQLQEQLSTGQVTGLRGFVEACFGQAMGSLAKKRKNGGMKLKESATLAEICEAFRLLHHVHNHCNNLHPTTAAVDSSTLPDVAAQALGKLQALYHDPDVSKQDLFILLNTWHSRLRSTMNGRKFSNDKTVTAIVGNWMMITRLQGRKLKLLNGPEDSHSKLAQLLSELEGPVTKLVPEQILLVARAGSYMYGLSTPDSDVDYIVVYQDATENILSACGRLSEAVESRGPSKKVEYGAYEARLLSEMLLKGSVIILELVYLDTHDFVSPLWHHLCKNKEKFVTELAIQQYIGLIKNNFTMLNSGKHAGTSRERKLFYQIFHKVDSVRHMMRGVAPPIRVTGPLRDFIMRVRTEEPKDDLSRDSLMTTTTEQYNELRRDLAARHHRLPEQPDFNFLADWLLQVRGLTE